MPPQKRKADATAPNESNQRPKIEENEQKPTPLSSIPPEDGLGADVRLQQVLLEGFQTRYHVPAPRAPPKPAARVGDFRSIQGDKFPNSLIRKLEETDIAGEASENAIYIAAYQYAGRWVDPEFVVIGAYCSVRSANWHMMKHFGELHMIYIEKDMWAGEEEYSHGGIDPPEWNIGKDGCLEFKYYDADANTRAWVEKRDIIPLAAATLRVITRCRSSSFAICVLMMSLLGIFVCYHDLLSSALPHSCSINVSR